jgi:hypothetical protein
MEITALPTRERHNTPAVAMEACYADDLEVDYSENDVAP